MELSQNGTIALALLVGAVLCVLQGEAAVPEDLSNFQNEYVCDTRIRIVRPRNVQDVQDAVALHDHIMAVGEGHSWNKPFFCSSLMSNNDSPQPSGPKADGTLRATLTRIISKQSDGIQKRGLLQQSGFDVHPLGDLKVHWPRHDSVAAADKKSPNVDSGKLTNSLTVNLQKPNDEQKNTKTESQAVPLAAAAVQKDVSVESPQDTTAANIVMTTIRPLTITVDEDNESAWIDSGIKTIDVLDYLGNYVTDKAPRGWTLPAFPWFVYQSIGGAVATGTHGSSLVYNSLSHQVLAFRVVLGNGTLSEIDAEHHPFLMKAFRISLGKLGIITAIKMKIVQEQPVSRTQTRGILPSKFTGMLRDAQEMYKTTRELPQWMNESQVFWLVQNHEFMFYTFRRADDSDPHIRDSVLASEKPEKTTHFNSKLEMTVKMGGRSASRSKAQHALTDSNLRKQAKKHLKLLNTTSINFDLSGKAAVRGADPEDPMGVAKGLTWEKPQQLPENSVYGSPVTGQGLFTGNIVALSTQLPNKTLEAHRSYISIPEDLLESTVKGILYDQYEVAVPVDRVADCLEGMMEVLYDGDLDGLNKTKRSVDKGFRTAPLIRFVGKEDGLLSLTNDMPRVFINLEDYIFYNSGRKRNERFFQVMSFLRGNPACSGRLHWGKAGWPDKGCWHGAAEYPNTWCDFGCAVRALDPEGKFSDLAADRWNWKGASLDYCCTETGYDTSKEGCTCNVMRMKSVDECPPPPFYTSR